MTWPPGDTVTVSGPAGWPQLMFMAASVTGCPAVAGTESNEGKRRSVTMEFEHVIEP